MTKIDIFSGFLGAGKTTLIKKLLNEAYSNEKLVLIENEFGEIGIDGGFLKEAGVEITEMNSGCICCSLVGDFAEALKKVISDFAPDRILIEPSGVGKLSDVIKAVSDINTDEIILNGLVTVVDAKKCKMYIKNFGEFYNDQLKSANCVVLSRTKDMLLEKIDETIELIKSVNPNVTIVSTDWEELDGKKILQAIEGDNTLNAKLEALEAESTCPECGQHHDEHCECGNHHEHHHHDEHCECGHHHEHHHHDEHCECGHHHEHHHHADDVFTSWGTETTLRFTKEQINKALNKLEDKNKYGFVLRAKGIVADVCGEWIHFDYTPGEIDIRTGSADITGRLCIIGSDINTSEISELFGIKQK